MEAYLLKSTACLAIFFIFYKLLLEKESIHQLKRYYLLVSLLLSFVIPFVSYTTYEFIAPIELSSNTNIIPVVENIIEEEKEKMKVAPGSTRKKPKQYDMLMLKKKF